MVTVAREFDADRLANEFSTMHMRPEIHPEDMERYYHEAQAEGKRKFPRNFSF
jgi:hypothetical protein